MHFIKQLSDCQSFEDTPTYYVGKRLRFGWNASSHKQISTKKFLVHVVKAVVKIDTIETYLHKFFCQFKLFNKLKLLYGFNGWHRHAFLMRNTCFFVSVLVNYEAKAKYFLWSSLRLYGWDWDVKESFTKMKKNFFQHWELFRRKSFPLSLTS